MEGEYSDAGGKDLRSVFQLICFYGRIALVIGDQLPFMLRVLLLYLLEKSDLCLSSGSIASLLWTGCPCFRRTTPLYVTHYLTHFVVLGFVEGEYSAAGVEDIRFPRLYTSSG